MGLLHPTPRQAVFELLFAGSLWGFGFVATAWALDSWSPQGLMILRFGGAFLLGEFIHFAIQFLGKTKSPWKGDFLLALPAGIFLGGFLLLQAIGLQSTTATKSGFITCLYVVFVPVFNYLAFRKKAPLKVLFYIFIACSGTFLLMGVTSAAELASVNRGDLWTLLCTLLAAIHIIYVGRISPRIQNAFRLNNFQALWAMLTLAPLLIWHPEIQHHEISAKAAWGMFVLIAACSALAFFLQIRNQKVLSDTTASMLFLLESPYACLFAYFLMGDRLNLLQSAGAGLILLAALLTVRTETKKEPPAQSPHPASPSATLAT